MVYISSWQEYQEAAEALYTKSPNKVRACFVFVRCARDRSTDILVCYLFCAHVLFLCCTCPRPLLPVVQTRYCVKWKASEGKLVLKITDDTTVRSLSPVLNLVCGVLICLLSDCCTCMLSWRRFRSAVPEIQNALLDIPQ